MAGDDVLSLVAADQRTTNRSQLTHGAAFAGHRARTTALLLARAPAGAAGRLCVLGAGNCHDLELEPLADAYAEVTLVDLDGEALDGARARCSAAVAARLRLQAPVDLSGQLDKLERWGRGQVTPEELLAEPRVTSQTLAARLSGPFDVVVSTCLLTQLQHELLSLLSDRHPLFQALRQTLSLTHLRTLYELTAPGGRALLVTEITSARTFPLEPGAGGARLREQLAEALAKHDVFRVAHPSLLRATFDDDPVLHAGASLSAPLDPWLWQHGTENLFLVYALEMERRPRAAL